MRLLTLFILLSLSLGACAVDAEPKQTPKQSTPQEVVRSFFDALKANDLEAIKKILAPRRAEIANSEYFNDWLNIWRQCDVVKFVGSGEALISNYDETLRVKVEYKCVHRPNFVNGIKVSRVGDVWYWDDN